MDKPSTSNEQNGWKPLPGRSVWFRTSYKAEFPNEGVTNSHGYLFHHFLPFTLSDAHILRLENYGIIYKKNIRFSREEDEIIRENWKEFAEEYNFAYEDARIYVGFLGDIKCWNLEDIKRTKKENDLLVELAMWPRLCRKLENRSAAQVQNRICNIFDPYFVGRADPIPLEIAIEANMRYQEGENFVDLALEYGYPLQKLRTAFASIKQEAIYQGVKLKDVYDNPKLLDTLKIPRRDYLRFFTDVLKNSQITDEFLRDTIANNRYGWKKIIKKEMEGFNWTILIPKYRRQNEKSLRKEWFSILSEVHKMYYEELDANFLGNNDHASDAGKDEAWDLAIRQTLPRSLKTLPVMKLYCHALARSISKECTGLYWNNIDTKKLLQKLQKYQIIHESNYDLKSCECYKRVADLLRVWNRLLFRFISFPFRAKDKLKIAEHCYDQLIEKHGKYPDSFNLPHITKIMLVESTIVTLRKITKGEWTPPKFLRQWIRSSQLMSFFSSTQGSEVHNEEDDLRIVRKFIFPDKKSLEVHDISKYGRAVMKTWRSNHEVEAVEPVEKPTEKNTRGWHPDAQRPGKLSRKRRFDVDHPSTTPARQPFLFETIVESPQAPPEPQEMTEEPGEMTQNAPDETILAGLEVSQPVITTPIKKSRKTNHDAMIFSPIIRKELTLSSKKKKKEVVLLSPIREKRADLLDDHLSGFDSDVPGDDGEQDDFSHLRLTDIRPLSQKRSQEQTTDITWDSIFG